MFIYLLYNQEELIMKKIAYTIIAIIALASCNNSSEFINRARCIGNKVQKINTAIISQDIYWGEEALIDSLEVYYTELKELSVDVNNAELSSEEVFKVKNAISVVSNKLFETKHLVNEHFNKRIKYQKNSIKNEAMKLYQQALATDYLL